MNYQSQQKQQTQHILPLQIQMLGIYHLNAVALELRVKQELEDNPLLEIVVEEVPLILDTCMENNDFRDWEEYGYDDIPDHRRDNEQLMHNNSLDRPMEETLDFRIILKSQLRYIGLDPDAFMIGAYIIDCCDDDGLLPLSTSDLTDSISFSFKILIEEKNVEVIINQIRLLEPGGICSSDIRSYLIFQLKQLKATPKILKCIELMDCCYQYFQKRNFDSICTELQIDENELNVLFSIIGQLKLKPIEASNNIYTDSILLKNLFTKGIKNEDGYFISNKVIQLKLKEIIDSEDKSVPFNDLQLVKLLQQSHIKIARRTVAKYRDLLNIPITDMRKILAKPSALSTPVNF